jgi:dienelactone hydrolase
LAGSALASDGVFTNASAEGPAQTAYAPPQGRGPAVLVLSGASGEMAYRPYAMELAKLGYYVVLLEGKDILSQSQWPEPHNLKKALARAKVSPQAVPGKAAVIGFSLGGGGALLHAAAMPESVSMVVAYYPSTRLWADKMNWLTRRFAVPVLVLAGEQDRYNNCCLIEHMRAMETAAKTHGAKFELVVYPEAAHGFNLFGSTMRADDDRDAWRRTLEMLRQHQPPL